MPGVKKIFISYIYIKQEVESHTIPRSSISYVPVYFVLDVYDRLVFFWLCLKGDIGFPGKCGEPGRYGCTGQKGTKPTPH